MAIGDKKTVLNMVQDLNDTSHTLDATKVGGLKASQLVRSDTDDTLTGNYNIAGNLDISQTLTTQKNNFKSSGANTKELSISRVNISNDKSELRINIGDTQDTKTKLSVGITKSDGTWVNVFDADNKGNINIANSATIKGQTIVVSEATSDGSGINAQYLNGYESTYYLNYADVELNIIDINNGIRPVSDDKNLYFNGKDRQVLFETSGTTPIDTVLGNYPFVWIYTPTHPTTTEEKQNSRLMILQTDGSIWTKAYGWLHNKFLGKTAKASSAVVADTATNATKLNNQPGSYYAIKNEALVHVEQDTKPSENDYKPGDTWWDTDDHKLYKLVTLDGTKTWFLIS